MALAAVFFGVFLIRALSSADIGPEAAIGLSLLAFPPFRNPFLTGPVSSVSSWDFNSSFILSSASFVFSGTLSRGKDSNVEVNASFIDWFNSETFSTFSGSFIFPLL